MCKRGKIKEVLDNDLFTIKYNQCSNCDFCFPSDFKNLYHKEKIMQRFNNHPINLKNAKKPSIQMLDYEKLNHNPKLKSSIIEAWKEMGMHCYSCNKPKLLTEDTKHSYCHNNKCSRHLQIESLIEIKI